MDDFELDAQLESEQHRDEELISFLTPHEYACYQVGRADLVVCYLRNVSPGSDALKTVERTRDKWRGRRDAAGGVKP